MHKSATKCNETIYKWCKNKHGASKIIDTFETYHVTTPLQRRRTSLKRKELREYILVSLVSTLRLVLSLTCILLVTCLFSCLPLIGNSPSCTSSEFTLCQALKFKKIKNSLSAYSPPSSRPYRSFQEESININCGVNHLTHSPKHVSQILIALDFALWGGSPSSYNRRSSIFHSLVIFRYRKQFSWYLFIHPIMTNFMMKLL
jgi:hypothetical protein